MNRNVLKTLGYFVGKTSNSGLRKRGVCSLKTFALAIMVGVLLSACAAFTGRETMGQYVDDTGITTSVKSAIAAEPTLHLFQIHVETMKNVVQLSGFVDTKAEIATAGRVARNVEGVKKVENNLKIRKKV